MRLLVINNTPTPNDTSFFAAVARRPEVTTRVVLLAPHDANRAWRVNPDHFAFDHRILPGLHTYVEPIELPLYVHWGLWTEMRRFQPDVIAICGYHHFATLEVLAFARLHHRRTLLWSGSHLLSGFLKRGWVEAYKRRVIPRFDAYVTYGTAARDLLVHYGARPERIVVGCNTVDVHWFRGRAEALRPADRAEGPLRLLFVGRLVSLKNVGMLIAAVGHLQRRNLDVTLTIVGDGVLRPVLERQVADEGVRGVTFSGFLAGDRLVEAYVGADALVLPSLNEAWGLVVNEAAACGTPSVVSTRAGAAQDLIRDGDTGFTFDPIAGALETILERLARDRPLGRRMGLAARQFILAHDHTYGAGRLIEAAELALARQDGPVGQSPLAATTR
jgi:glycosyltransferase involved in cell wall biosynthesis